MKSKTLFNNALLVTLAVIVCSIIIEILVRLFLSYLATPEQFLRYASYDQLRERYHLARFISDRHLGYVTTPNYQWDKNKHNALGFRGDEITLPKPTGIYRIVCIGGSTTYSDGVIDYTQSYPALLQSYLREQGLGRVEVINAGVPGYTSLESLINLQTRVLDLEPDLVIFYENINDVHARLVWPPSAYRGDYSGFLTSSPFFEGVSLLEYSSALRMLMVRQGLIEPHGSITRILATPASSFTRLFGIQRRNGSYPDGMFRQVSAERMLAENRPVYFERNLKHIAAVAQSNQIGVVFATFAYSSAFPDEVTAYPEYQVGIAEGNQVIRAVAAITGAYLFDFAELMPTDKIYFTDGIHFTEAGNKLRARVFGEYILEKGIIGQLEDLSGENK